MPASSVRSSRNDELGGGGGGGGSTSGGIEEESAGADEDDVPLGRGALNCMSSCARVALRIDTNCSNIAWNIPYIHAQTQRRK